MNYLPLNYFGDLPYWSAILKGDCAFAVEDVYKKQSLRNRTVILTSQGAMNLSVPVIRKYGAKTRMKDVEISYVEDWQKNHWKSIESAYRNAPFYEYFEAELETLYAKKEKWLVDLNSTTCELIASWAQLNLPELTSKQDFSIEEIKKLDEHSSKKEKSEFSYPKYWQVFEDKNGFINNVSVLDGIMCEGVNVFGYL